MNNSTNKLNPVETIGRGLRAALHGTAILDTPPSRDNKVNRRAGRTAIAGLLLFSGALGLLASQSEPLDCVTFKRNDFISYEDTNVLASEIASLIDPNSVNINTFDNIQDSLQYENKVEVCGSENIYRVALATSGS
ncbi:MAG: hypothetical protein NTV95_03015 [Candidatus Saccharibacteria bacterium]|nr:hypothetical protein [Candidatus Saccharibacteria bacterium]